MNIVKILAVDDHEMTTMGYKYILEDTDFEDFEVRLDTAKSYETAKKMIEDSLKLTKYDIILLDIQLSGPTGKEDRPKTGEDVGILAREISPESKIVFMSSFSDNYRINSIMKTVSPEGYMVKTEVDQESLQKMVLNMMNNETYYTHKALTALRKRMSSMDISLDENDRTILYHLSIGTKTKDIVQYVSLSLPGVELRKRHLKVLFGVEKQNDQALVTESRNKGFI